MAERREWTPGWFSAKTSVCKDWKLVRASFEWYLSGHIDSKTAAAMIGVKNAHKWHQRLRRYFEYVYEGKRGPVRFQGPTINVYDISRAITYRVKEKQMLNGENNHG